MHVFTKIIGRNNIVSHGDATTDEEMAIVISSSPSSANRTIFVSYIHTAYDASPESRPQPKIIRHGHTSLLLEYMSPVHHVIRHAHATTKASGKRRGDWPTMTGTSTDTFLSLIHI